MNEIEIVGKTVDEALDNAARELRVKKEALKYEIVSSNEQETKIKASIRNLEQEISDLTKYLVTSLGFKVNIETKKDDNGYYVNIRTRHSDGLLIGRKGDTLAALQHLVLRIMRRTYPDIKILIDVGGYRMRRENFLRRKTEAIARIVQATGREMALDPLTEKERQVVEKTLSRISGVRSYTIGSGVKQNVIIAPAEGKKKQPEK
ncbi:MAG: Jag N-terminal domain-containing protein [candidate division WOR-3 bacterium]